MSYFIYTDLIGTLLVLRLVDPGLTGSGNGIGSDSGSSSSIS